MVQVTSLNKQGRHLNMSSDWSTYRLGDIAITQSGGTPSRSNNSFFNGEIPWVKSGELKDSTIYASEEKISTEAIQSSSAKVFESNTLLLAMYGATVGKTGILKIRAATNQAVCAIRPKENNFNIEFLKFYLIFIRPQLLRDRYGGAQPNISQTLIQDLKIPLPLLTEQKNIAAHLFKIQQAIEIQESIIEKTRKLKISTLHHVFTRGLRVEQSKETEIGPIPESWEVLDLDSVLKLAQYGLSIRGLSNGQYPILRMNCQIDGQVHLNDLQYVNLGNDIFEKFKVDDGDILFNRTNSWELVGRTAIYHSKEAAVFASYLIRLKLEEEKINPDYLNCFFNMDATQRRLKSLASRGVSQSNISASKLKTFQVPVPAMDEQLEIASILRTIDQKIDIHIAKKSALQDLFKTMLNKLMTGEIRVKDMDIDVSEVSA
jgi:type I restriction enzyme S subunit